MGLFKGGIPYAVDIKRLNEAFPLAELKEGRVIPHQELEGAIDRKRGTDRYYGVVDSWISRMKSMHGVILCWEIGEGVKVLDPAGVFAHAETRTRQKIRQTGRALKEFAWVDRKRLDDPGRARFDHVMRVSGAIKDALEQARKQLAVELGPAKSLPRPAIIAQRSAE